MFPFDPPEKRNQKGTLGRKGLKHCYLTRSVIMKLSISSLISRKKLEARYEFIRDEKYSNLEYFQNYSENHQSTYHLVLFIIWYMFATN